MAKEVRGSKFMHKKSLVLFILLVCLLLNHSCASYSFVKIGKNHVYKSKPIDCDIEILTEFPGIPSKKIGICTAESFNELKNRTDHVIEKLKECGCVNGGDFILLGTLGQQLFQRKGSSVFVSGTVYIRK